MNIFLSFLLCSLAVCLSCSSTATQQSNNWEGMTVAAGRAGGFSGSSSGYLLSSNNKIQRFNAMPGEPRRFSDAYAIPPDSTVLLFRAATAIDFRSFHFTQPGNMSYFVEIREKDTAYKVVWGAPGANPPMSILHLYETIESLGNRYVGKQ